MTQGYTPEGYVFSATYDAENRLTSLIYNDGAINHEMKYFYNSEGILAKVEKYENSVKLNEVRFIRAEFLPVQERDGNNQVLKEYIWGIDKGGGIGGLLNLKQEGLDYSYLYDGKGNVMALIDSGQNLVASYRYDEFGVLKVKTGSLNQPFMFSTKQYDESTGLSYYGYRFYNPAIGRWMTRDPLGELGGINLYGFVGNSPINLVDPYGLLGWKEKAFTAMTSFWKIFGPSVLYVDDMIIKPLPLVGTVILFLADPEDTIITQEEEMKMLEEWDRQRKEGGKCAPPPPPPPGPGH